VIDDPARVSEVLRDPSTFPPDNALEAYTRLTPRSLRVLAASGFALPPTLASNSSPSHRPIRRTIARFLSPHRVASVEGLVRGLTSDALGGLRSSLDADGVADLVRHVAGPVPASALFVLFGLGEVPPELKRWSQDSLELFWGTPDAQQQFDLALSAADYYRWLLELARRARRDPGEDLFSALVALGLDDKHVAATAYFLLIAGQETTSMLISGIMLRLLRDGDGWIRAGRDERHAVDAVEAALREESSVPTWRRTTRGPVALGPTALPPKAELLLTLTGAGGSADLAFGVGAHRCLGAALARMEARVVVHSVAAALPGLRLVESSPPRVELLSFAAPARVLVTG
jgi:cytochrome P450